MSLIKLEVLVLLYRYKKVTDVAKQMNVKQPTISYHMKSLEEEYGVPLFEKKMGEIFFTEAGEALYHYAVKIHALANETKRVVQDFATMERGTLRIGASYVPGIYLLSDLMLDFFKQYPNISVHLEVKTAPIIQKMLLEHKLDIGLISTQTIELESIIAKPIIRDELVVVLPKDHHLVTKQNVTVSDIVQEPLILHDTKSTTRQIIEAWAKQHRLHLKAKLEVNSIEIIKKSVANGHGITFISKLAIEKELLTGELACIPMPDLQTERFIYCCYHGERILTKPIRLFLDEILSLKETIHST